MARTDRRPINHVPSEYPRAGTGPATGPTGQPSRAGDGGHRIFDSAGPARPAARRKAMSVSLTIRWPDGDTDDLPLMGQGTAAGPWRDLGTAFGLRWLPAFCDYVPL